MTLTFTAPLWAQPGETPWYFVSTSVNVDDEIRALAGPRVGFGAVRVEATIGSTTWRTSVFPAKNATYVLPVKAAVRRAEGLEDGDRVTVSLTLLDLG